MEGLNRIKLIQYLIDEHNYTFYLEIGTETGESFFPIRCSKKSAVDPCFKIKSQDKFPWYIKNPYNIFAKYYEVTSDQYFLNQKKELAKKGLDIILIDGLHTFLATLKDVLNSLKYLNDDGTIILHDCFPPHEAAGIVAENEEDAREKGKNLVEWTGEWCGDTWKAIAYLIKKYPENLKVLVLNVDYGLGVIKIVGDNKLDLKIDDKLFSEINTLGIEDLYKAPEKIINLKSPKEYFSL